MNMKLCGEEDIVWEGMGDDCVARSHVIVLASLS